MPTILASVYDILLLSFAGVLLLLFPEEEPGLQREMHLDPLPFLADLPL